MTVSSHHLIWIDLEMTGLNPEKDRIIEIATIVTDSDLHVLAEGPVFAIHQDEELLSQMDDWNTEHHTRSGLLTRVRESCIDEKDAERETLNFLKLYLPEGKSPMCGNSVWQDRRFLSRYMPELEKFFYYRMIDVTTIKELALRWAPRIYNGFQKESQHLALADIRDSIEELKYYRQNFLRIPDKES